MIILRIVTGIREHFPLRVTEWIMTAALFAWSTALSLDPGTFASSRSFFVIAQYGTEATWSTICMLAALFRLAALTINGTFPEFRYSPHFRACASVVSCVFWGQITLGVLLALFAGGSGTDLIAYTTFMAIELWNFIRAWADVGAAHRRV